MIYTKHPIDQCEVCAAQVEADEVGAMPTAGHCEQVSAEVPADG